MSSPDGDDYRINWGAVIVAVTLIICFTVYHTLKLFYG